MLYAIAVALNDQNINNHPERITKMKLFINKVVYNGVIWPTLGQTQ